MKRFLWKASMSVGTGLLAGAALIAGPIYAQEKSAEEELHVHRIKSGETSPYDAFAYLNRIPLAPTKDETVAEYAGNVIFSRLSNIEGRIQLKVVKGFDMPEYLGYKSFTRAWTEEEGIAVGNCISCHTPPAFGGTGSKHAPALRNLKQSGEDLKKIIHAKIARGEKARGGDTSVNEAYKLVSLTEKDVDNLVAFLQSLKELPQDEFREAIVHATILDTSNMETL